MADLPSIADRVNDIEVAANAPLTESLFRKKGSDINLLLDFLGITDGSTAVTGVLADLLNAVVTVEGHSLTKQVAAPTNTTTVVGTYNQIKYVDRVFYARNEGFASDDAVPRAFMKQIDGGPIVDFNAARSTPSNTTTQIATFPEAISILGTTGVEPPVLGQTNITTARKRFFDGAVGSIGFESAMRSDEWAELGTLSWREFNNSAVVRTYHESGTAHIYMAYKFNLCSAPIF